MLLKTFFKNLNIVLNSEEYGNSFNISEFNGILDQEQIKFLKRKVEEQYSNPQEWKGVSDTIFSSKLFYPLIVKDTIAPTAGVITIGDDLSADYLYWLTMSTTSAYLGQTRDVSIVAEAELTYRKTNLLSPSIKERPVAEILGDEIRILPNDIASVDFAYIKKPTTPFLDFYQDSNGNRVYLTPTQEYTLTTGETYLDEDGVVRESGYAITSRTAELEFHEDFHSEFFDQLLSLFSVRQGDTFTNQFATIKQQSDDAK